MTPDWLHKHTQCKINEMVVLYIDKEEFVWPPGDPPEYSTRTGISNEYCFLMRGGGGGAGEMRVAGRRFSCWCPACCIAFENGEGMDVRLVIHGCRRKHLSQFSESSIECREASGIANARVCAIYTSLVLTLSHSNTVRCMKMAHTSATSVSCADKAKRSLEEA